MLEIVEITLKRYLKDTLIHRRHYDEYREEWILEPRFFDRQLEHYLTFCALTDEQLAARGERRYNKFDIIYLVPDSICTAHFKSVANANHSESNIEYEMGQNGYNIFSGEANKLIDALKPVIETMTKLDNYNDCVTRKILTLWDYNLHCYDEYECDAEVKFIGIITQDMLKSVRDQIES